MPVNLPVFADKAMISTILRNLISNAIKFTNTGGKIVISTEQRPNELVISVLDSGVGMNNESIGKLFRIEENYSTLGTQKEKGTGLGLLLCKEFVDKHGGRIGVESESGKGSKFFFSIPNSKATNSLC
jgi:signal transduction histidine kinase